MSDSSWPSRSLQTECKYMRARADASPGRDGNRSAYCLTRVLQLVLVLGFGIHGTAWPAEQPSFTDVTETSGIARLVNDHYASNPTWWLSGLHLVDLDGDGDLDLFLSAHGRGNTLAALNDGGGQFTRAVGS